MPNEIELLITARDTASRVLDQFGRPFVGAAEGIRQESRRTGSELQVLERNVTRVDASFSRAARTTRALAMPLASELAPSLGRVTSQMTTVVMAAAALGGGFATIAAVGAGLAGVVGGQLYESWKKNREELVAFNRAVASFDMSRINEQGAKARRELEEIRAELAAVRREREAMDAAYMGGSQFGRLRQEGRRRELRARELEQEGRLETQLELEASDRNARSSGAYWAFKAANQRALRGAFDFELRDPIEQQVRELERQARDLEQGQAAGLPYADLDAARVKREQADRLRVMQRHEAWLGARAAQAADETAYAADVGAGGPLSAEQVQQARAAQREILDLELGRRYAVQAADEARFAEAVGAGGPLTADQVQQARATQREMLDWDLARRFGAQASDETRFADAAGAGGPMTAEDVAKARASVAEQVAHKRELLVIEREILSLTERLPGLSADQQEQLALGVSTRRESLRLQELEVELEHATTEAQRETIRQKRALVVEEERLSRAIVERGRLERTDFGAGAAKGFREVRDELNSSGRAGEEAVRSFAGNTQRAMSDLLFMPIERGWKRTLEDLPKQYAMSMLRTLTDMFARAATGQLFNTLQGVLPSSATPFFGNRQANPAVTAAGATIVAAGNPMPAGYQVVGSTQVNGQNALIAQADGSSRASTPSATVSSGPSVNSLYDSYFRGGSASSAGVGTSGASTGIAESYGDVGGAATGGASAFGTGSSAGVVESYGDVGGAATGGAGGGTSTSGASYGQYLAVAAAVVQGGMSLYRTIERDDIDDGQKAYEAFHDVADAVAAYYTGGLSNLVLPYLREWKTNLIFGKPRIPRKVREAREARNVLGTASSYARGLEGATSLAELWDMLVGLQSGYVGGESPLAIAVGTYRTPLGDIMNRDELLRTGRSLELGAGDETAGAMRFTADDPLTKLMQAFIGKPNGQYPTIGRETFFDIVADRPEDLYAGIQAGVGPHLLEGANGTFIELIKQKVAELDAALAQLPFGVRDLLPLGHERDGIERISILPFSRRQEFRGRDLLAPSEEALRVMGDLSDDDVEIWLRRLVQVDRDRNLGILEESVLA